MTSPTDTTPEASPPRRSRGLLRRTLVFASWAALTSALVWAVDRQMVVSFRATSLLGVDPMVTDLYGVRPTQSFDSFMKTNVQLLTSANVLTRGSNDPRASELPRIKQSADVVADLRRWIKVAVIPETYLIQVSMDSSDGQEAATLVNAVVDSFMEATGDWADGMTRSQIKNLESYHVDLQNKVDEIERRWKDLVSHQDLDQRASRANLLSNEHGAKLEAKAIENELARLEAQAELDALKARPTLDRARIEVLETRVAATNLLDGVLKVRRASAGDDLRRAKTDEVNIQLLQEERKALKKMDEAVILRLGQLKFESKGEARVRLIQPARPNEKAPGTWHRPVLLSAIPLATLALFVAGSAWFAPKGTSA